MRTLFWIFFGLGIALFIAAITTICIRKTREKFIHLYCNVGCSLCAVVCSTINLIING